MLTYKGYTATIKVDTEAKILHGRLLDIADVVNFQGKTVEEAQQEFEKSVDIYLEFCQDPEKSLGKPPTPITPPPQFPTPFAEYEYDECLSRLERKIRTLFDVIKPFLASDKPDMKARFLAEIWPFLNDEEFQELAKEIRLKESVQASSSNRIKEVKESIQVSSSNWIKEVLEPNTSKPVNADIAHKQPRH
jgi:predicted RNase H-like HicB family nuclease